jgi:hypothetical protein
MVTTLSRQEAAAIVAAGLCLSRLVPARDAPVRAGPWILSTIGERLDLPPAGVIADLGALLLGGRLDAVRSSTGTDDPALAAALRRYEDAVLGRLAVDGRLVAAGFAVARLPREMHGQAVGILVSGLLARIGFEGGVEIPPGVVRELTERKPEETTQRGFALLRDDERVRERLAAGYAGIARAAQKSRDLIGDADLFALENLAVLGSLTQRLAIADVLRAQEAIAVALPQRFPRRRRTDGDVASKLEDESVYPAGGFASVSTTGSLENLVTSELIYMDPPAPAGAEPADVDLFDMRYVEGELLYYTRDEAIFVRRRRLVILALDADLVRTRVKDRELPWQRIVLVLGLVLVLTKKLVELLGDEALELRVVFAKDAAGKSRLDEERALAELMLREWRDRGIAAVLDATWDDVAALAAASARRALVEVVSLRAAPAEPPALDPRVVYVAFVAPGGPLDAWSRASAELLSAIL